MTRALSPQEEIDAIKKQLGYQTYGKPPRQWLDTGSKRLNKVLGSEELGLCYGKTIVLAGLHSTAKSLLATFLAGLAQQDGAQVGYLDFEHSFDPEWVTIQGLDPEKVALFQPELTKMGNVGPQLVKLDEKMRKGSIKPEEYKAKRQALMAKSAHVEVAEETCNVAERWMIHQRVKNPDSCKLFMVIDSTTAIEPREEQEAGLVDQNMKSKMLAPFLNLLTKRLNKVAFNTNGIVIYISQIRINPMQRFGNPETLPGGKGILYYPSIITKVRRAAKGGVIYAGGEPVGVASIIVNLKNKAGGGSVEGAKCGFKAKFSEFDWRFTTAKKLTAEMGKTKKSKDDQED